jgi:hypothetical protein
MTTTNKTMHGGELRQRVDREGTAAGRSSVCVAIHDLRGKLAQTSIRVERGRSACAVRGVDPGGVASNEGRRKGGKF